MTENPKSLEHPTQEFPDRQHLYYLVRFLQISNRLLVPKSRQMTCSWCLLAFFLHKAIFFPSRLIFFSSKKETDAHALVDRTQFIYKRLPKWMKAANKCENTSGKLSFENRSKIIGVPAGPDQLRSYTPTDVFADEAVFQEEMKSMLAGAIPAIGQQGTIVLVSSCGPSYFQELVNDD